MWRRGVRYVVVRSRRRSSPEPRGLHLADRATRTPAQRRRSATTSTRTTGSARSSTTRPTSSSTGSNARSCSPRTVRADEPGRRVAAGRCRCIARRRRRARPSFGRRGALRTVARRGTRGEGVDYRLVERRDPTRAAHVHLANSSRSLLLQSRRPAAPFVVTSTTSCHGRGRCFPSIALLAYPQVTLLAAAVVVHSALAADMLRRDAGQPRRLEVLPHPAPRPPDLRAGRRPTGARLARRLPHRRRPGRDQRGQARHRGARRRRAACRTGGSRSPVALRIGSSRAAQNGTAQSSSPIPDDLDYGRAIVAADCVLCLRSGSVGETNGPLLDALGAGRAVIANGDRLDPRGRRRRGDVLHRRCALDPGGPRGTDGQRRTRGARGNRRRPRRSADLGVVRGGARRTLPRGPR